MRHVPRPLAFLAILIVCFAMIGCSAAPVATSGVYEVAAPAASPCSAAASGPVAGPLMVAAGAPTLGVQYGIGPTDHAKAALNIPPNLVICFANGIRCAVDALFPQPTPSARYVAVQPVMAAPAPAAAPPCAPPPPPRYAPAAPVRACPEPPPEPIAAACTDESCSVPGR